MQYGHFDNARREYVIDRIDLPVSWTNYIGIGDMYGVFNHTAGGYLLYQSPEYHRISRFRPNGVPPSVTVVRSTDVTDTSLIGMENSFSSPDCAVPGVTVQHPPFSRNVPGSETRKVSGIFVPHHSPAPNNISRTADNITAPDRTHRPVRHFLQQFFKIPSLPFLKIPNSVF